MNKISRYIYKIVIVFKIKFYSYFDGKTQFSQIFLGRIFFLFLFNYFFFWGGGGQITASLTCARALDGGAFKYRVFISSAADMPCF